jgi:hypothetical protein
MTFIKRKRAAAQLQPQRKHVQAAKRLTVRQPVKTEQEQDATLTPAQITEMPHLDYQRLDLNQPSYRNGKK